MAWSTSDRRARLPKDWPTRVVKTKARAGNRCEGISLQGEPRWHVSTCTGLGAECDHDQRGDDHDLSNLRWLSGPCHTRKTQHEAKAAARLVGRKRPRTEQHPGRMP